LAAGWRCRLNLTSTGAKLDHGFLLGGNTCLGFIRNLCEVTIVSQLICSGGQSKSAACGRDKTKVTSSVGSSTPIVCVWFDGTVHLISYNAVPLGPILAGILLWITFSLILSEMTSFDWI
jgi:hypothetical protein